MFVVDVTYFTHATHVTNGIHVHHVTRVADVTGIAGDAGGTDVTDVGDVTGVTVDTDGADDADVSSLKSFVSCSTVSPLASRSPHSTLYPSPRRSTARVADVTEVPGFSLVDVTGRAVSPSRPPLSHHTPLFEIDFRLPISGPGTYCEVRCFGR